MSTKQEIIKAPFETKYGTVNPGDVVYAITTGYNHAVSITKGTYLGYTGSGRNQRVKLEVLKTRTVWHDNHTGKPYKWTHSYRSDYYQLHVVRQEVTALGVTTLQRNRILPISITADQLAQAV